MNIQTFLLLVIMICTEVTMCMSWEMSKTLKSINEGIWHQNELIECKGHTDRPDPTMNECVF